MEVRSRAAPYLIITMYLREGVSSHGHGAQARGDSMALTYKLRSIETSIVRSQNMLMKLGASTPYRGLVWSKCLPEEQTCNDSPGE
jgi:hypothetical protein